ncbi:MAG TPA: ABC transporter substrate-binding protein, partial [Thermoanaerobaculia bacterium]|nr:ABC transporter substrate-binding protein [Thermoanaerobaculia bacterium]
MSTRHSKETVLAFTAGVLLALAACRQSGRTYGLDTLVVALESSPLHLDPRIGIDQNSWRVHHVVFNGLMKNGAIGDYVPDLAESVTSEDGAVWKVRLRPGVKFHDGRVLGSRDVVYTYESLLAPSFVSSKKEPLRIIRSI